MRPQRGLGGHLASQDSARVGQLVGQQPQPGVAQVGLDDVGTAGDVGLSAQRPELAAQFCGQVLHPGEIRLHRIELAQGFLLALSMFENPRGLLDEAAPLLRRRRQDRIELTLTDDDMHLPADAGVRQ